MSSSVKPQFSQMICMPAFLQAGIAYCESLSTTYKPTASEGQPRPGDRSSLADSQPSEHFLLDRWKRGPPLLVAVCADDWLEMSVQEGR